jgi:hypothetical protein
MFEPHEINIAIAGGGAQGAWKMFGPLRTHDLVRRLR